MIEVKMYLYDATEIALMSQFEAILTQKRNTPPSTPNPEIVHTPAPSPLDGVRVESPASDAVLVNDTPSAPPAVEVDDVTVQRTITAYGQKHGIPATVAKMQEVFGISKASLCPAERRAEFVQVFGAAQ